MEDSQEKSAKEQYEEKKRIKEAAKKGVSQKKEIQQSSTRFFTYFLVILIVCAIGYGIYFIIKDAQPVGPDFSRDIPIMESSAHIPIGSELPEYNSNPPTSGPHYEITARSGFRGDDDIADQHIIHNLEHGDVWISYHPRVGADVIEQLRSFGAGKVIVTKREANETDIAVASWGRLDTFNLEDSVVPEDRINDFIKRHLNNGPERITTPTGGV